MFGRTRTSAEPADLLIETEDQDGANGHEAEEGALANNLRVFEQYNRNKIEFLRELLPQRKRVVYDVIPLLLHLEAADLIDCRDACQMAPHGVFGYEALDDTSLSFAEAFPGRPFPRLTPRGSYDPSLPIKSMCLIGSLGSIAQNNKSDFDYWVCYESDAFSRESFIYFREKLRTIEIWADKFAGAEVHFFPLDLSDVRADDFGAAGGESSGSALGKLLKEEFYRSLTLVAGQRPLWWAMPPGVDDQSYAGLADIIARSHRIDGTSLVDMGNVQEISFGEFYGAAIWQINKTMGSPFKSVIKMALLEDYMLSHGDRGLLCDELKARLIADQGETEVLDPYVLMFDRAATHLEQADRQADVDLLRRSMYLKSGVNLTLTDQRRTELPRKKKVMLDLTRQWGWPQKKLDHLNNYHYWNFRQSQKFSQEINSFIIRTYKAVSDGLSQQKEQVGLTISQRDLTVLGRKLFIFYSKRTNKIESIKNVIEAPPALDGLTLQPHLDPQGRKIWTAYRALLSRETISSGQGEKAILMRSEYLTEILIWMVNNQLWDAGTSLNVNAGQGKLSTYCTVPDLQALLRLLKDFFPPFRFNEINEEELLEKPRMTRMMLVLNLEQGDGAVRVASTGLCYQNNWTEVFFKGYRESQDGLKIARDFLRKHFAYDPLGALDNFRLFMPDRHFKKVLGPKLNKYFGFKAVQ